MKRMKNGELRLKLRHYAKEVLRRYQPDVDPTSLDPFDDKRLALLVLELVNDPQPASEFPADALWVAVEDA